MQFCEDLEKHIKGWARPYRDPKNHKTHKRVMAQIVWLFEDLVTNEWIMSQKGVYGLMLYRVRQFAWIWSAFGDRPVNFAPVDQM